MDTLRLLRKFLQTIKHYVHALSSSTQHREPAEVYSHPGRNFPAYEGFWSKYYEAPLRSLLHGFLGVDPKHPTCFCIPEVELRISGIGSGSMQIELESPKT